MNRQPMKRIPHLLILGLLAACNEPQQKDTVATPGDSVAAPGVVQPDTDSMKYKMPVAKTDTVHTDQQMPVAMPDADIKPK